MRLTGSVVPSLVSSEGGAFDLKTRNQCRLRNQCALGTQYTGSCTGVTPLECPNWSEPDYRKPLKAQEVAQPLGSVRSVMEIG